MDAVMLLRRAQEAGLRVRTNGSNIVVRGPKKAYPVVELLAAHKANVLAFLRSTGDGWSAEDWQAYFDERAGIAEFDGGLSREDAEALAFNTCITEWLNRNPASSPAGYCAGCGELETESTAVLPFGTEPGTHAWLHSECWQAWYAKRRNQAVAALRRMGIDLTC